MRLLNSVQKIVSLHLIPDKLTKSAETAGNNCEAKTALARTASRSGCSKIVIQVPLCLEQAERIADILQSGCAVLLNLQDNNSETARRLLDFIARVAYHNESKVWKIAHNTFLIAPYDAEIAAVDFPKYIVA